MSALLKAEDLGKVYRTKGADVSAVSEVTLELQAGESVAVMGPSGCGKSTLLRLLGLLTRPTSGLIKVEGQPVSDATGDRARLRNSFFGYVHQDFAIVQGDSVTANIEIPLDYARPKVSRSDRRARVARAAEAVGMDWALTHRAQDLSGGEQQRVAIARALINRPRVVLADEPTAALDSETAQGVVQQLLAGTGGDSAALLATHDPAVAEQCDRVLRIRDGVLL